MTTPSTRKSWTDKPPKRERGHRGSAHWAARLKESDVRDIRRAHEKGWTISALAEKFKLSWRQIWAIVTRRSWKHVE